MRNFILIILMFLTSIASAGNIGDVKSYKHWKSAYERNKQFQKVEYHYTTWCIYCPQQTAIIEQLARENPHVLFVKINADFFKRPGVYSYPTTFVAGRKFVGVTPKSTIQSLLKPKSKLIRQKSTPSR